MMKKFIVKVVIAVICCAAIICVFNAMYVNTYSFQHMNDMYKFNDVPEHIDVANFGASHSTLAFDWTDYADEFHGFNMGLGSQTLVYDAALFDYYFERFDENSTVIVDIMFKSLYETEPLQKPYSSDKTRYYQVLPREYIRQWNLEDEIQYRILPILGNRQNGIEYIEKELFEKVSALFSHKEESGTSNSSVEIDIVGEPTQVLDGWEEDAMVAEGKRRAESFMQQSGTQELGIQYEALIHMIEKCKENNIQIILVTVPTLPCHYEGFSEGFMNRFYQDMEGICEKYDVTYIDYTGDERFLQDYRLFHDTDHFNDKGAKFFTGQFLEDNETVLQFLNCK
ncbi:MAG: SGNH/GDSL hydrolase family protein [Butyrivibrio sp.]|nr:SGNH/GDSL hydrolase family protein [Butyrivibrio sp.]